MMSARRHQPDVNHLSINLVFGGSMRPWESLSAAAAGGRGAVIEDSSELAWLLSSTG
jgi:hypothetical protein